MRKKVLSSSSVKPKEGEQSHTDAEKIDHKPLNGNMVEQSGDEENEPQSETNGDEEDQKAEE